DENTLTPSKCVAILVEDIRVIEQLASSSTFPAPPVESKESFFLQSPVSASASASFSDSRLCNAHQPFDEILL
ncbi:hypothetical protein SDJN02_08735, partial [Cucurbita argyrosperma subsp. argyrosperma]